MSKQEDLLVSAVLRGAGVRSAIKLGVTRDLFLKRRPEWMYLEAHPDVSRARFRTRFPDFRVYRVDPEELDEIVTEARKARLDYELGLTFARYQKLYGNLDTNELVGKMMVELGDLINRFSKGNDVNIVESWREELEWVRQRKVATDNGNTLGYPFGIPTLDEQLGGLQAPDLVSIVARQGEFKTWMSLYFAVQAMLSGGKVMYVSLEMSRQQLVFRIRTLLSRMLSELHANRFKTVFSNTALMMGSVDLKEYAIFLQRSKRFIHKGLVIPEAKDSGTIAQFRGKMEEHKPDIAFYDYFGLSMGENARVENWVEAANMSRGFKQLCTEYNVPIVLNAQANRSAGESKEAPRLDQIAYTDNLGRDSDRVFSMRLRRGELSLHVAKNRFGEQGQTIHFDLDIDKGVINEIVRGRPSHRRVQEDEEA